MKQDNKSSILVILTGLTILGLVLHKNELIIVGLVVSVVSLLSSKVEELIVYVWMKIAHVLGWINSKVLLSFVFFAFLTPLSFLKRMLSSNDSLKLKTPENTNWVSRNHLYTSEDLKESF